MLLEIVNAILQTVTKKAFSLGLASSVALEERGEGGLTIELEI